MKKLFLILFIAVCAAFIYIKVQILGDANSKFNRTTRYSLGKYQFMRSLFGLHSYGDARKWYLNQGTAIVVEKVQANGTSIDEKGFNDFIENVKIYTGRQVTVFDSENMPAGVLSDDDLGQVAKGYRRHILSGQPNLFIIYAEDFKREGIELAKTFNEYAIVLSHTRLKEVAGNSTVSLGQYTQSTLLHELGHQLGLEHNDNTGCIMNERVEKPSNLGEFNGAYTDTKFCDFELKQLNDIKSGK